MAARRILYRAPRTAYRAIPVRTMRADGRIDPVEARVAVETLLESTLPRPGGATLRS